MLCAELTILWGDHELGGYVITQGKTQLQLIWGPIEDVAFIAVSFILYLSFMNEVNGFYLPTEY